MNDDRKYQGFKAATLELLKMGMPNKVIQICLKLCPATVHNYGVKLRDEKAWDGKNVSVIEAIPRMLKVMSAIEFDCTPLPAMEFINVKKEVLLASLNEVLEVERMIDVINHACRQLKQLQRFGFHDDIPKGYRNLLNALNPQPVWPQINGKELWSDYLYDIYKESRTTEIGIGTESLAAWQSKTIDAILDKYSQASRKYIVPVFPLEICRKIEESLFPTLREREVRILKMYYGIGQEKMTQNEIGNRLETSSMIINQIIQRTLRRIKHESRLESILAMPLTWETVARIITENTPPKPIPNTAVSPENALQLRVCDLDFSVRNINIFRVSEIITLQDLTEYSEADLLRIRNMGAKSIAEIKAVLKRYKHSLRTPMPR